MSEQPVLLGAFGMTDVGRARDHNEDAFVISEVASGKVLASKRPVTLPLHPQGVLLMVCDGMGGAAAGEVASWLACETVARGLFEEREVVSGFAGAPALISALRLANRVILGEAHEHSAERGMGTTSTAALVLEDRLVVAQVGDSRAYLFRGGVMEQLTKDQSLAMAMVDSGVISPADMKTFPHADVILQALGVQPEVTPVTSEVELVRGDTVLLCSDGLHAPVADDRIAAILSAHNDLDACARALVDAALAAGGPDNVTVVLARYQRGE
jgi:protein phosphatase